VVKIGLAKKQPHSPHQTQWAAQFAVASELCKRGYQVALTLGNHPIIDLMVVSPQGIRFVVDVKGLYKGPNFWRVRAKEKTDQLFYVFALVPSDTDKRNRFFILTQGEANEGIRRDWNAAVARRKAKGREHCKSKAGTTCRWLIANHDGTRRSERFPGNRKSGRRERSYEKRRAKRLRCRW
jgi:hypothetical protein